MPLTEQQREDLKTELQALNDAEAPIAALVEPLRRAIEGIDEVRSIVLLRYGLTETPETCEGCECFLLPGDKFCPTYDAGQLCERCAPTYGDMKQQIEEQQRHVPDEEEAEGHMLFDRNLATHFAAGGKLEDIYAPYTVT